MTTKEVAEKLGISVTTVKRNRKKIGKANVQNGKPFDWTDEEVEQLKQQLQKNKEYLKYLAETIGERNRNIKPMLGKKHSEETRKKIGEKSKGRIVSDETREKLSIAGKRSYIEMFRKDNPDFSGIFAKELFEEKKYRYESSIVKSPYAKRLNYKKKTLVFFEKEDLEKIKKGNCGFSNIEKEIAEWLEQYIEIVKNDRTVLNGKELDIYVPSKKVAIEFDGLWWHCSQFRDKQYHYWKFDECRKQSIRLIHIFEDEWRDKQEIVKSLILSAIGIYEKKYFARKCTVKEIEKSLAKEFLEANHINGYVNCSKAYGLFNGTELLQVITIGLNRFTKEKKLELLRMATKLNTQVVGGFSKLLKDAGITEIESYVDNRLFNASGYISSGWTVLEETPISYYYTDFKSRFNRMKFQKAKLPQVAENDTEEMRANALGYFRIYDCGTTKLKYTI